MKKLYDKSEIWFSVLFIIIYVVGTSLADSLSQTLGLAKAATLAFEAALLAILYFFIKRNGLTDYYGICKPQYPSSKFLFYIPLAVLASVNLWHGVQMNYSAAETACYVGSMLLVGFLEELIFRGLLFKAISKDNVKTAIIVSSVTFGIGHIVNLINGSGAELVGNLCQVCYAVAIGFLFVIIFYRGKSLVPCMVTHSVLNALSAFGNKSAGNENIIPVSVILIVVSLSYSLILLKTTEKQEKR